MVRVRTRGTEQKEHSSSSTPWSSPFSLAEIGEFFIARYEYHKSPDMATIASVTVYSSILPFSLLPLEAVLH